MAGSVLNFGKLASISMSVNSLGRSALDWRRVETPMFKPSRSSRDISGLANFSCCWVAALLVKLTAQPKHDSVVPADRGRVGKTCTVLPLKALMRRMLLSVQATASM